MTKTIDNITNITISGQPTEFFSVLGEGGSKTVLDVSFNGLRRALAIPNAIDASEIRDAKWISVEQESENAKVIADLGLLTIPTYERVDLSVDGIHTPGMAMTPFSELPFKVFDSKDGTATWERGALSDVEYFGDLMPYIKPIARDIAILSDAGIILKSDSISFAQLPSGELRLFLYDLQGMGYVDQKDDGFPARYTRLVVSKLDNIFDFEQSKRFSAQGYDFRARDELARQLLNE